MKPLNYLPAALFVAAYAAGFLTNSVYGMLLPVAIAVLVVELSSLGIPAALRKLRLFPEEGMCAGDYGVMALLLWLLTSAMWILGEYAFTHKCSYILMAACGWILIRLLAAGLPGALKGGRLRWEALEGLLTCDLRAVWSRLLLGMCMIPVIQLTTVPQPVLVGAALYLCLDGMPSGENISFERRLAGRCCLSALVLLVMTCLPLAVLSWSSIRSVMVSGMLLIAAFAGIPLGEMSSERGKSLPAMALLALSAAGYWLPGLWATAVAGAVLLAEVILLRDGLYEIYLPIRAFFIRARIR